MSDVGTGLCQNPDCGAFLTSDARWHQDTHTHTEVVLCGDCTRFVARSGDGRYRLHDFRGVHQARSHYAGLDQRRQ